MVFIANAILVLIERLVFAPIKMNAWIRLIIVTKMHIVLIKSPILNVFALMDMKAGINKTYCSTFITQLVLLFIDP